MELIKTWDDFLKVKPDLGQWAFVYSLENKNPHKIRETPPVLAFKSRFSPVCALFPQEMDEDLLIEILKQIGKGLIATCCLKFHRKFFKRYGAGEKFLDVAQAPIRSASGKSMETACNFVYGHR